MKRGAELTLNTIIIAALVVLVLIILAFILIRGSSSAIEGTKCESNNGKCATNCEDGYMPSFAFTCDQKETCCVPLSKK